MLLNEINLLWLTENYYPNRGGMAQSCDRITHTLRSKGIRIDIVHFVSVKTAKRKFLTKFSQNYLDIPVENDEAHALNLLWNILQNPTTKQSYTHVVAYGGSLPVLAGPIISQWLNIPLVTLIRGNDFDQAVFSSRKRETLFYALEHSQQICTVTSEKRDKIQLLFPTKKVTFIPNGIDTTEWTLLKSNIAFAEKWRNENVSDGKKVMGLFGFLKAKKGLDFFIEVINQSEFKSQIHLLLSGEPDSEITELLNQSELTYSLLPFCDRFELLSYYPACDAVAIPSFYDGLPNVLLEAGLLGIPIIASTAGGMNDVLENNRTAFTFHPGDKKQAIKAISAFFQMPAEKRIEIQNHCKLNILNNYTHHIEAERYIKIF